MLKRNIQYHRYTNYVYPKDKIVALLNQALDLTPSKQSTIPYRILVLGPNQTKTKDFLYKATIAPINDKEACDHNHQVEAPWVLLFYKRKNDSNHSMNPETMLIEIGMFSSILTQLCIKEDLNVSYTKCFLSKNDKIWEDAPVKPPLFALSIGRGQPNQVCSREIRPEKKNIFLFK